MWLGGWGGVPRGEREGGEDVGCRGGEGAQDDGGREEVSLWHERMANSACPTPCVHTHMRPLALSFSCIDLPCVVCVCVWLCEITRTPPQKANSPSPSPCFILRPHRLTSPGQASWLRLVSLGAGCVCRGGCRGGRGRARQSHDPSDQKAMHRSARGSLDDSAA